MTNPKRWHSFAVAAGGARKPRDILTLAALKPELRVSAEDLNAHDLLLNTPSGVVDLEREHEELRPHDPGLLLTQITRVPYVPDAPRPEVWLRTLKTVIPDDGLRAYFQRVAGYLLSGLTVEQVLFFFHGSGANGKTVVAETLRWVMGDYAASVRSRLLTDRGADDHPTSLDATRDKRGLFCPELPTAARFSEENLKSFTGGDTLRARKMHQDETEFRPRFKLVICGNSKPRIRGRDDGIWRRMHLVPFDVKIPLRDRDPRLGQRLQGESEGILRWMVQGFREYRRLGLKPPAVVLDAVQSYREEQDPVGRFLEERTFESDGAEVSASSLHAGYLDWAARSQETQLTATAFGRGMRGRGVQKRKTSGAWFYVGIDLLDPREDVPF